MTRESRDEVEVVVFFAWLHNGDGDQWGIERSGREEKLPLGNDRRVPFHRSLSGEEKLE